MKTAMISIVWEKLTTLREVKLTRNCNKVRKYEVSESGNSHKKKAVTSASRLLVKKKKRKTSSGRRKVSSYLEERWQLGYVMSHEMG
jgi:hypothetical protein